METRGGPPTDVAGVLRELLVYLRHIHGGITARTMRSNMEMQSTVREGNEMMVEAMYGVMRDLVENGTLQAIRRVREVMRERPPEQDAAL